MDNQSRDQLYSRIVELLADLVFDETVGSDDGDGDQALEDAIVAEIGASAPSVPEPELRRLIRRVMSDIVTDLLGQKFVVTRHDGSRTELGIDPDTLALVETAEDPADPAAEDGTEPPPRSGGAEDGA